jgi:solute carrier family 25 protein 39/40
MPGAKQVWDIVNGAAAGTAAVVISMPLDVIKTYMQTTHASQLTGKGVVGQVL